MKKIMLISLILLLTGCIHTYDRKVSATIVPDINYNNCKSTEDVINALENSKAKITFSCTF